MAAEVIFEGPKPPNTVPNREFEDSLARIRQQEAVNQIQRAFGGGQTPQQGIQELFKSSGGTKAFLGNQEALLNLFNSFGSQDIREQQLGQQAELARRKDAIALQKNQIAEQKNRIELLKPSAKKKQFDELTNLIAEKGEDSPQVRLFKKSLGIPGNSVLLGASEKEALGFSPDDVAVIDGKGDLKLISKAPKKPDEFITIENTPENRAQFGIPDTFNGFLLQANADTGKLTAKSPGGEAIEVTNADGSTVSITRGVPNAAKVEADKQQAVQSARAAIGKASNIIKQIKKGGQGILGIAGNIGDLLNATVGQFTGFLPAPERDQFVKALRATRNTSLRAMSDDRGRFTDKDFDRVKQLYAQEGLWESVPSALNAMYEVDAILLNRLVVNDANPEILDPEFLGVTPNTITEILKRGFFNQQQAFRVFALLFPEQLENEVAR